MHLSIASCSAFAALFGVAGSQLSSGLHVNDIRTGFPTALPTANPVDVGLSPAALSKMTAVMQREVDAHHVPGVSMMIARSGKVAYRQDVGALRPAGPALRSDAIFRIYSMTKPIVSIALMMLVEEGKLFISDPIAKFVPEMASPKVGVVRNGKLELEPIERAITIQDLLRHTSGLTYAFTGNSPVQRLYGQSDLFTPDPANAKTFLTRDLTTAEFVVELAKLPLIDQPGAAWNYSHSTDVIGRVVEVVSAQSLGAFVKDRILAPLGMHDTAFYLPADKRERLAEPFAKDPDNGKPVQLVEILSTPHFESGGGGLFSTMDDYARFAQMLYLGGTLANTRFIGRKTLEFVTADHLGPGVRIVNTNLLPPGHGFGLGFAVRREVGMGPTAGTPGEFFWGGLAGTVFWIAPQEELVAIMMIQGPGQRDYFRYLFRNLVYAAVV
jgi:CubicO group peptidase (beta-lactamase class C family)